MDNDIKAIENLYKHLLKVNCTFYSLGDFNLRDNYIDPLLAVLNELYLFQIVEKPTRLDKKLDLVITNNPQSIVNHSVYQPFLSDHCLTDCKIKFYKTNEPKRPHISYRPLKTSKWTH